HTGYFAESNPDRVRSPNLLPRFRLWSFGAYLESIIQDSVTRYNSNVAGAPNLVLALRLVYGLGRGAGVGRGRGVGGNLDTTVIVTGSEAIPFATTSRELMPVSVAAETSKLVETSVSPVATPIVLCPCVRA